MVKILYSNYYHEVVNVRQPGILRWTPLKNFRTREPKISPPPDKIPGYATGRRLQLIDACVGRAVNAEHDCTGWPNTIDELKKILQTVWDDLPQNSINKAILSFVERLRAYVKAWGGHFENVLK